MLTSVGIYLGRVLRWNSWTVLHDPEILVRALLHSPSEPGRAAFALLATVLATLAFLMIYRVLGGPSTLALRTADANDDDVLRPAGRDEAVADGQARAANRPRRSRS